MRDLIATALAALIAIVAAAVMWGWSRSPVPTFLVFTPVLHGMMLGAGLMWLVQRLAIRSRAQRAAIGLMAGVVTVAALTLGQYVSDAYDYRDRTQERVAVMLQAPHPATDAFEHYDRNLLQPVAGRSGIIGYLHVRDAQPWRRRLRVVEALLTIGIATALCVTAGGRRAARVH